MKKLTRTAAVALALGASSQAWADIGDDLICVDYPVKTRFVLLGPELDVRPALTVGFYQEYTETSGTPGWTETAIQCLTDGETCGEPDLLSGAKDSGIMIRLTGFLAIVSKVTSGEATVTDTLVCNWGDAQR